MSTDQTQGLRILVIDDDPEVSQNIIAFATILGHRPHAMGDVTLTYVNDIEATIREAEQMGDPFKVATIDWAFEIEGSQTEIHLGQAILDRLSVEFPDIVCILISGSSDAPHRLLDLRDDYNLAEYIQKDKLNLETLKEKIDGASGISVDRKKLFKTISEKFSLVEVKTLCFYVDSSFEEVGGETVMEIALNLIEMMTKQDRLLELKLQSKQVRPDIDWNQVL